MKTKHIILAAIIALTALTILPCNKVVSSNTNQEILVGTRIGDRAPEINLPNTDGKLVPLSSFRGKVVLIDFWASWWPLSKYGSNL